MKILIQNYSSPISSEPMYLNQTFQMTEGIESMLWSPNSIGVYDVFDRFKPDVFVCHHLGLSQEIVTYLASNPGIKLAVNITNISQENLDAIEKLFTENSQDGIDCKIMFSNNYDFVQQAKPKTIRYEKILPCADVYFLNNQVPEYSLDAAIIASRVNEKMGQAEEKFTSYHKMKLGAEQDDNFDMNVNVMMLAALYGRYEEVVICDSIDIAFSQVFFDAFLKSKKVSIKLPESDEKFFTMALSEIFEEEGDENLLENIKDQIKKNHTCVNRARTLLEAVL